MNSLQYTIRSIPPALDTLLRKLARDTGRSLNDVVLDTLAKGAGVAPVAQEFHDLDWFTGSKTLGSDFDDALRDLNSLPNDLDTKVSR